MASIKITMSVKDQATKEIKKLEQELKNLQNTTSSTTSQILNDNKDLADSRKKLEQSIKSLQATNINFAEQKAKLSSKDDAETKKTINKMQQLNAVEIKRQKQRLSEIKKLQSENNKLLAQERKVKASQISNLKELIAREKARIKEVDKLNNSTSNLANTTIRYLRWVGTLAGAYYGLTRAYDVFIGKGIEINKIMENNTLGIAALLSANTEMTLSNGKVVDSYEKFAIGQKLAAQTMLDLRDASVKTYATFPQLTEIYQQAIGQTLSMGDAFGSTVDQISKNTIELSQRMSNIAGSIGMPMDRVREEIRSLLSGNASTDSLISTMLFGSPSQANKAIRDAKARGQDGMTELLDSMLEPFDVLAQSNSFSKAVLDFQNQLDILRQEATEPIFNDLTREIKNLADILRTDGKDIAEDLKSIYEDLKSIGSAIGTLSTPFVILGGILSASVWSNLKVGADVISSINDLVKSLSDYNKETKNIPALANMSAKTFEGSTPTNINIPSLSNVKGKKVGEFSNLATGEATQEAKGLLVAKQRQQDAEKLLKELEKQFAIREKQLELETLVAQTQGSQVDKIQLLKNAEEERFWIYQEAINLQVSEETQLEKNIEYQKAVLELIKAQNTEKEKAQNKVIKSFTTTGKKAKGTVGLEDAYIEAQIDLIDLEATDEAFAEVEYKYDELKANLEKERLEVKINFTGFDELSNSLAASLNTIQDMSSSLNAFNEGQINSMQYSTDMVGGYANITGAMTSFYDEDDERRKKQEKVAKALHAAQMAMQIAQMAQSGAFAGLFIAQENAKSIAAGQTAVAVAAQSSPWTGFATAAAMAAMLASFGIALSGSGGSSESLPQLSEYEQNLRDIEVNNEPIVNRLDRQISILEAIELQGSASAIGLQSASQSFQPFVSSASNTLLSQVGGAFSGYLHEDWFSKEAWDGMKNMAEGSKFVTSTMYGSVERLELNLNAVNNDFLGFLKEFSDNKVLQKLIDLKDGSKIFTEALESIQDSINDYAVNILETVNGMKDASDSFKSVFDKITGTTFYETKRLEEAYADFDRLRGDQSYAEYLRTQINAIDSLSSKFGKDVVSVLLDENLDNINERANVLSSLAAETGRVFAGGVEDAINYIESIELVGEEMTKTSKAINATFTNAGDALRKLMQYGESLTSQTASDYQSTYQSTLEKTLELIRQGSVNSADYAGKTIEAAESYLGYLEENATSSAELAFAQTQLANQLSGVEGTEVAATLDSLQNTVVDYLGADSDVVTWLKTINGSLNSMSYSQYTAEIENQQAMNTVAAELGIATPFANGGIVTTPTLGLIGEAGYNEAVIPLSDSNRMLGIDKMIAEQKNTTSHIAELNRNMIEYKIISERQVNILIEQRDRLDTIEEAMAN